MPHLQWLDLSHNYIKEFDFDGFKNTKNLQVCGWSTIERYKIIISLSLQVLYLSHNRLVDLPPDLFRPVRYLRIIDLQHNHLRSLPDNLFYNGGLEK